MACAAFHDTLLLDKVVLLGCPKFDPATDYAHKFGELFGTSNIVHVTVAVMQAPCRQGLLRIVQAGMAIAGKVVPMTVVIAGFDGTLHEAPSTAVAC